MQLLFTHRNPEGEIPGQLLNYFNTGTFLKRNGAWWPGALFSTTMRIVWRRSVIWKGQV